MIARATRTLLLCCLTALSLGSLGTGSAPALAASAGADLPDPTTKPRIHAVQGAPAVYDEGRWAGGVGILGKFTFRNGGDDSVVEYYYGFGLSGVTDRTVSAGPDHHGRSARIEFRPEFAGPTELVVRGVDAAGRWGPLRTYSIYVDYAHETGRWDFSEGAGTVAGDSSGNGHPLSVSPSTQWTEGNINAALHFDEPADVAQSESSVVDTRRSFTVTARVRLDTLTSTGVAVSQDGDQLSGFNLGYVGGDPDCPAAASRDGAAVKGCFQMWAPDGDTRDEPSYARARSSGEVRPGEWYYLVGMYDATAPAGQRLRVWSCNVERFETYDGAARRSGSWRAAGSLRVGQGELDQTAADPWHGDIDTVTAYDGAFDSTSVTENCYGTPGT